MKLRVLMATAAIGLVISGVAIAATNAPTPATPAAAPAPAGAMTATANSNTAPTPAAAQAQSGKTVLDLADSNSEFSTLAKAIKAAGLEQTLAGKGPITVFAPTNAAFAKLGPAKLNDLMKPQNKAELTQILTYHVVPQTLPATASATPTSLTTAEGQPLSLTKAATGYQIQNAKSEGATISASNGSIIAIDTVLTPEAQAKMGTAPSSSTSPTAPATTTPASAMAPATAFPTAPTDPSAPKAPAAMSK